MPGSPKREPAQSVILAFVSVGAALPLALLLWQARVPAPGHASVQFLDSRHPPAVGKDARREAEAAAHRVELEHQETRRRLAEVAAKREEAERRIEALQAAVRAGSEMLSRSKDEHARSEAALKARIDELQAALARSEQSPASLNSQRAAGNAGGEKAPSQAASANPERDAFEAALATARRLAGEQEPAAGGR